MSAQKKLIIGNWKMNGDRALAASMALATADVVRGNATAPDVVICPPFPYAALMSGLLVDSGVKLGAQNVSPMRNGAFTGEVSATMLADMGLTHVIVGHSERRAQFGEMDEDVAAKAEAAHRAGLTAIICVGEGADDRTAGIAFDVVRDQVVNSIPVSFNMQNTVIAYEPVWAIGSGRVATPMDIEAMHALIRTIMQEKLANSHDLRIVYGGSVKADNAAQILGTPHVDGVLVGGASIDPAAFSAIIRAGAR